MLAVVFVLACLMPLARAVPLKLLPYDNKNKLQVVVDMPEGTTLERTRAVTERIADRLAGVAEVRSVAGFAGTASPMDFNGMVRRYYLRDAPYQADLRVVLAPKDRRAAQSHAIMLRLRDELGSLVEGTGANVKLVEVPPGPPVLSTVVVELYGEATTDYATLLDAARRTAARLEAEPLVVDVDTVVEAEQTRLVFDVDRDKAALSGIATADVAETVRTAIAGRVAGFAEAEREANPLPIRVRLPYVRRTDVASLEALAVKGRAGVAQVREAGGLRDAPRPLVLLGEIGAFETHTRHQSIHHKDLEPVAYVTAEVAGRMPAEVVFDVDADLGAPAGDGPPRALAARTYLDPGGGLPWSLPEGVRAEWAGEGEWWITLRVFRDLGIAFAVALLGIFVVLRVQTGSYAITGIVMLAIPLTVLGIMPGFWLLNAVSDTEVAGYPDPVLFTATAMIGMIALDGIVVRNSLVLIEFIEAERERGAGVRDALLRAGAVRFRPVFLTAGTTVLGNLVITLDPIFSGLAWAIIFGMAASTLFTLGVVPAVYYLLHAEPAATGGEGSA